MSVIAVGSFLPPPPPYRRIKPRFTTMVSLRSDAVSVAETSSILRKLKEECATPLPVLRQVADAMSADMRAGLAAAHGLPMIPSFVEDLPTGNEKGLFYALDLGGTNFRVLRVQLGGNNERVVATDFDQVSIPPQLMSATCEELFDFIALGLAKLAAKDDGRFNLSPGKKGEIGFTFSFPVRQTSIDSGILVKWTKGFAVSGAAGRDVVACLNEAMERQGLDMQVSALVNDAVATLAGAEYWDNDVAVAIILGTGTNACYVEQIDAIPKLQGHVSSSGKMIISTEWGAFSKRLPLTEFDRAMDAASINPGEQIFEKTISGMYLGEIVRLVLLEMAATGELFGKSIPENLYTPFILGYIDGKKNVSNVIVTDKREEKEYIRWSVKNSKYYMGTGPQIYVPCSRTSQVIYKALGPSSMIKQGYDSSPKQYNTDWRKQFYENNSSIMFYSEA